MTRYDLAILSGYRVGDDGTVSRWIKRRGAWKQLTVTSDGNVCVWDRSTKKKTTKSVGRLVLEAFGPPRPFGCRVLHYPDAGLRNNDITNLRWAPANSSRHGDPRMAEYGRKSGAGERSRILSDDEATRALDLLSKTVTAAEVAEYLDVHRGVIDRLIAGSLSHIPRPSGIEPIGNRWLRGDDHPERRFTEKED